VRIYLDTAPIIYVVEQVAPYSRLLDQQLMALETVLIASDLSRLECRVKPLRDHKMDVLADYDQFFQDIVQEVVALSRAVMDHATEIRAVYGFPTPDAIHLAAATAAHCEMFLTNDLRLQRYTAIKVDVLD